MKLNPQYLLREVGESVVLVPFGTALVNFNGMLTFNQVGAFLAKELTRDTTTEALVDRLLDVYGVDAETATRDVAEFVANLRQNGAIVDGDESVDATIATIATSK